MASPLARIATFTWQSVRLAAILVAAFFAIVVTATEALSWADQPPQAVQPEAARPPKVLQSAPVSAAEAVAGNAHCWCEATCHGPNGQTFTRNNHANAPGGYTQGLNSDRAQCQSTCNQWLNSNIANWASEENVCGALSCEGTSHVGSESSDKWRSIGASHQRTCCPAGVASNGFGCGPWNTQDITAVFRVVQAGGISSPYKLVYDRTLNPGYEPSYQAYANYLASPGKFPTLHHMWVNYLLAEVVGSNYNHIDWGAVRFLPGPGPAAATSFFQSTLQVNKTYEVSRSYFYQDANDQNLDPANIYGDPSCKAPRFQFRISLTSMKMAGRVVNNATVTYLLDGKVVRTEPVGLPLDRIPNRRN